jgi:hypothetical protein
MPPKKPGKTHNNPNIYIQLHFLVHFKYIAENKRGHYSKFLNFYRDRNPIDQQIKLAILSIPP